MGKGKGQAISTRELVQIVDTRHAALVLYARHQCVEAAEDVVQNALLKLIKQKPKPDNPIAWLFRTIRNEAINQHRKNQRRTKHETEAARQRCDWFLPHENPVFSREAAEKLRELNEEQREIVLLRIWSGLTFDEIADLVEKPKTSVFRLYTTALEELRKNLS